jgi:hypothetical protein
MARSQEAAHDAGEHARDISDLIDELSGERAEIDASYGDTLPQLLPRRLGSVMPLDRAA